MCYKIRKIIVCLIVSLIMVWSVGCRVIESAVWNPVDEEKVTEITNLTVNYEQNPIGIEQIPQFGWRMKSNEDGQLQTAYRIVVAETAVQLEAQGLCGTVEK